MHNWRVTATVVLAVLVVTAARLWIKPHQIQGEQDEPLPGAYLAVLMPDGELYEMRTDRNGRYRFPLAIRGDTTGQMIICASGHVAVLTRPSWAWETTHGMQAGERGLFPSLREQGWTGPTPPECGDQTHSRVLWAREQRARRKQQRQACDWRADVARMKAAAAPPESRTL